jgi:glucoamylase
VLSGERAEHDLQVRDQRSAAALLTSMSRYSATGLVPEQAWEDPDVPASPYGADPANASIGFVNGQAAGSASPLTWAQAQELRLIAGLGQGRTVETPAVTTRRYVTSGPPGALAVTLSAPAPGATVGSATTTVTGTTSPGASVDVASADTTTGGPASVTSTTAAAGGSFSATVPVGFGHDVITATATSADGKSTGYAQVTVTGQATGTTVLDVTDPAGDDTGPGTYQYPTAADFHAGAFDLTDFKVISNGTTVYLQATLRNLDPTFGTAFGAQLLDVYVRDPAAAHTSTLAAYPSRNYTIAPAGAWSQRVEVQGFAAPVWVDAPGNPVGTAFMVTDTANRTVTIALPRAQFGTPGHGWGFSVVLTGQDGFSGDRARAFSATPQSYTFGVCAPGGGSPVCQVPPATVPKAMDVITPPGVSQATELDPTRGPVAIQPVTVP